MTCAFCDDRIGVYEPAVVVEPGGTRRSSIGREPELCEGDAVLFHVECSDRAGTSVD